MIKVMSIGVTSFDLDHLDINWVIENVPYGASGEGKLHQVFDYKFFVLRSEAVMGPYEVIGGPFRDPFYAFRDNTVSLLHKWRQWYYKIQVLHVPSGETAEYGPASSEQPEPDLIAHAIMEQEDVLFREFIGRRAWLYPVRTFGPRCSCWDPTLGRRTTGKHLPCFGTGWLGGFMHPVEVFIQIDPNMKQSQISSMQEQQPGNTAARMVAFPPVSPRDILIESENVRWRVVTVTTTQRLRSVVHQELTLHEIPRGDIEYELPVMVNPITNQPSAERNFSNPQNLATDGQEHDLFALYGHGRGSLK